MNKLISLTILTLFFLVRQAYSQTTHIEAESWSTMNGVATEATSDAGGGENVGWIDQPGDWMEYSYTATTEGTYTVRFRLATAHDGAQFQIKVGTTVVGTVGVPVTGGFQTWQTVTATVYLSAGTQIIRLNNSGTGGWNFNWWELDAPAGGINNPPAVNAGHDQNITLPVNLVQLNGSATDADGTVASKGWSLASGPANYTFSSTTVFNPNVSNLVEGVYTFRLTATDNLGASSSDDIVVTVSAASSAWSVNGNPGSSANFIGTTNPSDLIFKTNNTVQAKITSGGEFWARKIKVTQTEWPDYVFDSSYKLLPLFQVEHFINLNGHLPDVPSEKDVVNGGLDVGDNQAVLLRKIEELTLYMIQVNKDVEKLKLENTILKKQLAGRKK